MSIFAEIVLGEKLQEMTRRAEKAEAALAAKRADAIQHHAEMIGEFADMVNQRDAAIARAETAEAALAEAQAELQASETLLDMERWQAGWKTRSEAAEDALAQCQHDLTEMIERKEYFRQCWEVAEAALAERDKPCVWCEEKEKVYGMVFWGSSCGAAYRTADMVEPGKFCLHCGHPIELQP